MYQVQSGFPLAISVFGDTANSGTVLGENPIRANLTGQPIFPAGTHTSALWFNPTAFSTPAAFTFGNVDRNTVYGPGMQTLDHGSCYARPRYPGERPLLFLVYDRRSPGTLL